MKKDEEGKNKEELEAELLKVRSEILWREREIKELDDLSRYQAIGFLIALLLLLFLYLFGEVMGFII